jgi:Tol biopolymer transport system component
VSSARRGQRLTGRANLVGIGVCAALIATGSALATSLPERTFAVSAPPGGGLANGESADPVVSASGRFIAFDSTATNLAPTGTSGARNVYVFDNLSALRRLVSIGLSGPANGDSGNPAIAADGSTVAFQSSASNLVAGDSNGVSDVFVQHGTGPIVRVSVAGDGSQANGPSSEPAISGDGRYVVFVSSASNLVPGDRSHQPEIFVRDLVAGTTSRVSVGVGGADPDGPSSNPAISADGRVVSFDSSAGNLVPGRARAGQADVYVRLLATNTTERVSVSTAGAEQNQAVRAPFHQVSSLSANGRFVAFDSDASNLVARDVNRSTDVFVRDRVAHTTTLVSENNAGFEGDNDSFAPYITPDGRFVAFESFARNLAPGGGPRENVFVRDVELNATSVIDVAPGGAAPTAEQAKQLLQRPMLSADGSVAAFSSTALNVTQDPRGTENVFLRLLAPPSGTIVRAPALRSSDRRPLVQLRADDPHATTFECRIDHALPRDCPAERPFHLWRLRPGHHVLLVRAGGPGMNYDPFAVRISFTVAP